MMALDSSALLAIVLEEPGQSEFLASVASRDSIIGAPTVLEAQMAALGRGGPRALVALRRILAQSTIEIVEFTSEHGDIAFSAFDRYGRGRHPAKLNFGDCMAYAVAKLAKAPLLYKGGDFVHTDITAAIPPGTT